jgi:catechol-2,3-dioxygenase
MPRVTKLSHAVLFVSDLEQSRPFYEKAFGLEYVTGRRGAAFLRAPGSEQHHDLALMEVGPQALNPPQGSVGLYHLAWEVETIDELAESVQALLEIGALAGASDHGATKSLYGKDPDGIEFEILWRLPREAWGEFENSVKTVPLDLAAELARWGTKREGTEQVEQREQTEQREQFA